MAFMMMRSHDESRLRFTEEVRLTVWQLAVIVNGEDNT